MDSSHSDTHPEAALAQQELMRRITPSRRFSLACSLTSTANFHARRAIARANPTLSQRDRDLLFVEMQYGREMADELRRYLEARQA